MTILVSAAIALLAAQTAVAEQRENKPFNTSNGRTVSAPPRVFAVTAPGGGAAANVGAAQPPAVTNAMILGAPSDGGRAFMGGRQIAAHSSSGRAVRRGGKAFWSGGRKADGGDVPSAPEEAPPNFSKPGALIRTTGQMPVYEKAETRTHTVNAGEIVLNPRKAQDSNRGPSVHHGPKDTPPPPTPTSGGSGYGSGAVANSPSPSAASSNDNNGSGNNSKGTDSYDGKGKTKALDEDPTGFNDAY